MLTMEHQRIIIESPLNGDFATNRRYATWCCRHMHECGYSPLASHLVAPWFMDDRIAADRDAGIGMPWFWLPDVTHYFFMDLGMSTGMLRALERCHNEGIPTFEGNRLPLRHLQSFQSGQWPPHTPGFGPEEPRRSESGFKLEVGVARALGITPSAEQHAYDESLPTADEVILGGELIESLPKGSRPTSEP
jgi:hypothetical protein